tara:strand:- start:435 stop:947 length:513 start_codon:yes stop_codon:yes gene_type:complete
MKPKIIKSFLPKSDFDNIQSLVIKDNFPWYYSPKISGVNSENKNYHYFIHLLFCNGQVNSTYFKYFESILDKLKIKKLYRMKLNFYHYTDKLVVHYPHVDYIEDEIRHHKGCIISLNTCDGFTIIENKTKKGFRVKSVKNQALLFDPTVPHSSTSCTDSKARINININYE